MRNNIWGEGERERGIGRNCKKDSVQNISFKKKKTEEEEEEKVQHILMEQCLRKQNIIVRNITKERELK